MKRKSIRVLFDTRRHNWKQNPYIEILAKSVEPGAVILGFKWSRALLGRYDLAHLHWPEHLIRSKKWYITVAARILFVLWMARLVAFRTPVVRTRHNITPHVSLSRVDSILLHLADKIVREEVWLSESTGVPIRAVVPVVVIPHGDYGPYVDQYTPLILSDNDADNVRSRATQLLCFGFVRPYKNFHEAIEAVGESRADDHQYELLIMGEPLDQEYATRLKTLSNKAAAKIELRLHRASDSELISAISATDFVLIPYDRLHSSGVLLLALTLGKPVIVRESPVSIELRDEFGSKWIRLYSGPLTNKALGAACGARLPSGERPNFEKRKWMDIGSKHLELYSRAYDKEEASA